MNLWWRRGASLIVLFVLAATPAVAAACAALCNPIAGGSPALHDATADGHPEAAMSDCHGAETLAAASALTSVPCDHHDDAGMTAAFLTAGREGTRIVLAQTRVLPATLAFGSAALAATRGPNPQPTPPRPTTARLPLRI